jgi:RHS repeat-associated protein
MPSHRSLRGSIFVCLLLAASAAHAQITGVSNDQATPVPGVGHDYIKMLSETVQPSNGQVSIRIDVPTRPSRATVPFAYVYNSAGLHHVVAFIDGKAGWVTDTSPLQGSGWSTSVPTLSAIQATNSMNFPGPPPFSGSCVYFTDYVFQDSTGARHLLPILTAQSTDASSPNHCGQVGGPNNVLLAGDGTYTASTTAPSADTVPSNPPIVTVVGPDGTVYSCPMGTSPVYSGWTKYFYDSCSVGGDRNGNVLSSQPTVSVTTTPENPPFQNFPFNFVPASSNPPQANCFGISSTTGPGQTNANQSINFPNGVYQFQYNPVYGTISQITYPSNGFVRYDWGLNPISEAVLTFDNQGLNCAYEYDTPAVTHRYVSFDGVNIALQQDFQYTTQFNSSAVWTSKQTIVVTKDCASNNFNCTGAPSFTTTYSYAPLGGLPGQQSAVESSVVYGDFSGNTLLTVTKGWGLGAQLLCELHTLNNGLISGTFYAYGSGNQITDKKEYDYGLLTSTSNCFTGVNGGVPPNGVNPTRETAVAYQSFPPVPGFPGAASIFDRPCDVAIHISSQSNPIADTHYFYDGGTSVCGSPGTTATAPVSNLIPGTHDETDYGPTSTAPRGNATKIDRICLPGCGHIVSTASFDETGQPISVTDPKGNLTQYSFTDSFSDTPPSGNTNTFLTKITPPTTNGISHMESFKYSYSSGQLTSSTDQNNQTTQYVYNDPLFRPSEIDYPDGGKTTFVYDDRPFNASTSSPSVTTTKLITSSATLVTVVATDGFGHTVKTLLTSDPDCASGDRTDTTYDGLGRVHSVSNPYCTTSDSTYGITNYGYDALGRTTQVTHPDGSTMLTTYAGPATQVQDEGNGTQRVTRVSQADGLGRLTSVCEVAPGPFVGAGGNTSASLIGSNGTPASCGLAISATGFLTTYQYDALDNLLQVNQSGLNRRTFAYDSLSRLTSATNPESGAINYSYDANGNLVTRIAPAPNQTGSATVTTTYTYDALNRLTQKSYSDGSTPSASYYYDVIPGGGQRQNSIGRKAESYANSCLATVYDYDPMGRISSLHETRPLQCYSYSVPYTYDLLGNMTSDTDGAVPGDALTRTYSFNTASRLIGVSESGNLNSQELPTVLSGVHYNALGKIISETTSFGEIGSYTYDNRGREKSSTTTLNNSTIYSFNVTSFAPNGNVLAATDTANGNWTYSYDQFNRLTGANQNNGASVYSYVYDITGNRWQQNGPHAMLLTFSGKNNRMDGYSYDSAGNLLNDGTHAYTYDAENRIVQLDGGNTATYVYDAEGLRATKNNLGANSGTDSPDPAGLQEFLFDSQGRLLHTLANGGVNAWHREIYAGNRHLVTDGGGLDFVHTDWLGTERNRDFVYQNSGTLISNNYSSLPFGDWLNDTQGVTSELSPLNFTGQMHDFETNLDQFPARYYSSTLGHFMSPDDTDAVDQVGDPQGLSLYSYVQNNPTNAADPSGHDCVFVVGNNAGLQRGDCSNAPSNATNVTYVPGRVDEKSAQYNPNTGTLTVNYTPYGQTGGALAVIGGVTPTHPGPTEFGAFVSRVGAGADNVNAFALQAGLQLGGRVVGSAIAGAAGALLAARSASTAVDLVNISSKIAGQMTSRGWTNQMIVDTMKEAIQGDTTYEVTTKATGAAATEYVSSSTGRFVVVDNSTKAVIQVSRTGFLPNHLKQ